MKKIIVDFKQSAFDNFEALSRDKRVGGLAQKFYRELFDFPPEEWGRLRREFGKDTFVSDRHIPFIIKVAVVEEKPELVHLYVTEYRLR
jgi:hypothetical protein